MKKLSPLIITFLVFFIFTATSHAASNFDVTRSTENQEITNNFEAIEDLFDAVEQQSFNSIVGYTQQSAANATLNIRGLSASINYLANSSALTFQVPSLGISKTFSNFNTRQENEDDFEAYIENNADGILTKMLQKMVATTASDPVAGNPNSLMSTMATADFDAAYDMASTSGEKQTKAEAEKKKETKREIGLEIGRFSSNGVEKNLLTLPLAYTHYFEDPRKKLRLSSPLSYIETNGSKAYKASFGATLNYPMNEQWSLIPAVRLGILGSQDMGSAALVYSGSLTSMYQHSYKDMSLMFGNMLSVMTTADLKIEAHELPYDISNQVMKNGISVEKPIGYKVLGKMASTEFSIANTQFFGDDLYIDNYTDLAVSIGTRKRVTGSSATDDSLHIGVTYTIGQHGYKGGKLNFGYRF